jgi:UDP-N-acetylmuramoyl-tripeptide--D-alanyl-D-alanine ligase
MKMAVGPFHISGWSIDSRSLAPGDLFIALRGPNHDGHDHLPQAFERGAVAALVDHPVDYPHVVVPDTQQALEDLGRRARTLHWGGTVVGVTGSAGKTSTKDIIAALLSPFIPTAKNEGNLNNHIGVPLSILRLPESARVAVLEMGMNRAGEIRHLCSIAKPNIGLVTNVGHAHIESFGSIEGIAEAKGELIESLEAGGTAILNADDPFVAAFRSLTSARVITYGIREKANVHATAVEATKDGAAFSVSGTRFETSLAGLHGVRNILAAIAVAKAFDIDTASLVELVRDLRPGKMRGERFTHNGVLVFNDCYNSNPDAARAMLDVLRDSPANRRIAVLGEMLELGRWAEPLHRDIGAYTAMQGISMLAGIRGAARHMVEAARHSGMPEGAAHFFDNPVDAGNWVRQMAQPGDAILFKGSRGTKVELALERFLATEESSA